MPRNALPAIAVKEELAPRRLKLPRQLDADIRRFARFYGLQTGGREPEENAVIIGILKDYLDGHPTFQQYLKDERRREGAADKRGTPAAMPGPGAALGASDAPAVPERKVAAS